MSTRVQRLQQRVRRCATPKNIPTTPQIMHPAYLQTHGTAAARMHEACSMLTPRPFCAPLQAEGINLEMLTIPALLLAAHYYAFGLLSARLSESGPCHRITLTEASKSRVPFARASYTLCEWSGGRCDSCDLQGRHVVAFVILPVWITHGWTEGRGSWPAYSPWPCS